MLYVDPKAKEEIDKENIRICEMRDRQKQELLLKKKRGNTHLICKLQTYLGDIICLPQKKKKKKASVWGNKKKKKEIAKVS